jgi:TatD DNase family protein
MKLFDSHAHYDDSKFDEDRFEIIEDLNNSGVSRFIAIGCDIETSKKAIEFAKKYDFVNSACGIHPSEIPQTEDNLCKSILEISNIVENANKEKPGTVVAIGEIGLDYHYDGIDKNLQMKAFAKQIELANKLGLPISIHSRDAISDTLDVLKNWVMPEKRGVFHCCTLNRELVKEALKLGFYISFAGPITFKNSKNADEIINLVPLDKMLIETDSPYLSPEPKRGTRNDSRNVRFVAEKIANVRGLELEDVANITYNNAIKCFDIKI